MCPVVPGPHDPGFRDSRTLKLKSFMVLGLCNFLSVTLHALVLSYVICSFTSRSISSRLIFSSAPQTTQIPFFLFCFVLFFSTAFLLSCPLDNRPPFYLFISSLLLHWAALARLLTLTHDPCTQIFPVPDGLLTVILEYFHFPHRY